MQRTKANETLEFCSDFNNWTEKSQIRLTPTYLKIFVLCLDDLDVDSSVIIFYAGNIHKCPDLPEQTEVFASIDNITSLFKIFNFSKSIRVAASAEDEDCNRTWHKIKF